MTRGIQQVNNRIAILHLHDRARYRDTTLLFNLHPIRGCVAAGFTSLYTPRNLNGTCIEEKLLRERGLTGIRVRDDGKTTTPGDFGKDRIIWGWVGRIIDKQPTE